MPLVKCDGFTQVSGEGLTGLVEGQRVTLGRPEFLGGRSYNAIEIEQVLANFTHVAKSPFLVGVDGHVIGAFDITDSIRPDAHLVVAKLKEKGLRVVMVTGDTEVAAAEISNELGGVEYLARRTPSDKVSVVEQYKRTGKVLMLGDGFNDAAALSAADVCIATVASIDISKDIADAVLVSSNLRGLVALLENSKTVARASASNILLALAFNAVGMPLAMLGVLSASYAMLIMVLSLLGVFANARLARFRLSRRLRGLSKNVLSVARTSIYR